jgi:hypothetical protein
MTGSENPFAFVLKRRTSLDAPFYSSARSYKDIDDDMWLYLLALVPKEPNSYARQIQRLLRALSPELRRYFLIRWFDSEWGSEGMEGVCTNDEWPELHLEFVPAFAAAGAPKHAELIGRLIPLANAARCAGTEIEQDAFLSKLKAFDRAWDKLSKTEDLGEILFAAIKADCEPYLHPPLPQQSAPPNCRQARQRATRTPRRGGGR